MTATPSPEVHTTCPYCGVGCGVVAGTDAQGDITIRGDTTHPANHGRLCSKGAALGQTLDLDGRLLYPEVDGARCDWDSALDTVAGRFRAIRDEHGPDAVAFYVSGQLLTEDYYVANKLMKGFIGSANIDTNSRLCMSSAVAGYQRAFGADTVPGCYEDLELADLVVLIGSNLAWCHPVLFQRLRRARQDRPDMRVVVIDPRRTPTCDIADLHLAVRPGTDTLLFNGLFRHLHDHGHQDEAFIAQSTQGLREALERARASASSTTAIAERCGLETADLETFYAWFARRERSLSLYSQGVNQSSCGTDKVNSIINCHLLTGRIGRPGMGPFSMTGQPNAMGGREVGGLANQLAAHMDLNDARHRDRVQGFWRSPFMPAQAGLKAVDLFEALGSGRVRALWVMATNPAVSLPDAARVREALAGCEFLVVSDCMGDTATAQYADVLLPALAWGEKDGTVTNSERRISRQRAFLPAPGEARPDWWILSQVGRRLGHAGAFDYNRVVDVFTEHARLSGYGNDGERDFDISAWSRLDAAQYDALTPRQWPITTNRPEGTQRLFGNRRFFTPNGKAQFVPVTVREPANLPDDDHPLILNSGRVRDHWHTMTRTAKSPRLAGHSPEPCLEVHPRDAAAHGLRDGAFARLSSRWGGALLRVRVQDSQPQGSVFAPIHWNSRYASLASIDDLINPAVDPVSGQPEFKHTPVRVLPWEADWSGFVLTRAPLRPAHADYWALVRAGERLWRCEMAGRGAPDWPERVRGWAGESGEWIEFSDPASGRYRAARLEEGRIELCLFVGPAAALPSREWLATLFDRPALTVTDRQALLSGVPPGRQAAAGRQVCACFGVGSTTLENAIREHRLTSVEAIGERLRAGTNCGSCIPELRSLLDDRVGE